jgi:HEAT repeat protein
MTGIRNEAGRSTVGVIVALALSLAYFASLAPYGLELADEGHLLHGIYRTYQGQLPYVDFHSGYSPAVYYSNVGVFKLLGLNLVSLRLVLALVNALGVVCLYWLARHVGASVAAAGTACLLYVGLIPFHDGQFAPFNIPYPAWYVTLFWLLSLVALLRWWETGRARFVLVAGLTAGMSFAFKQNGGLLNLAGIGIAVTLLQRPMASGDGSRAPGWVATAASAVHRIVPVLGALGFFEMMRRSAGMREGLLFALPLGVVVLWQMLAGSRRIGRPVSPGIYWRDVLLVSAGFLVVTLPWSTYFWRQLGPALFLRTILYIGAGYEQHYFIPYPAISQWGVRLALGLIAAVVLGKLVKRGLVPGRLIGAAALAGLVIATTWIFLYPPPMVEGFQRSVVMRVNDIAFSLVLLLEWAAIVFYLMAAAGGRNANGFVSAAAAGGDSRAGRHAGAFLIVLLSAILMHAQLYPRSDFMHLVYALPGVLILGARLLDAFVELWVARAPSAGTAALLRWGACTPIWALALIMLAPALGRIEYLARSGWGRDAAAVVKLEVPRAPLLIEPAAGRLFQSLNSTVTYLETHSRPEDFVFTFPCLDVLAFLADRRDPTKHGYYYPGSPGHAVEAEVIDALRATRPRYLVALHDHALFFVVAPFYYFNLRQHVAEAYEFDRQMGMFDVLRLADASRERNSGKGGAAVAQNRNDLATVLALWRRELDHRRGRLASRLAAALDDLGGSSPESLAGMIGGLDAPAQRLLAELVHKSRSAAGAAALAEAVAAGELAHPEVELFIRVVGAIGDLQSVAPLLRALEGTEGPRRFALAGALFHVTSKSWIENYWYVPSERSELREIESALPAAQLIQWIDDPWQSPALRSFAIRVAGRRQSRTFIPFLVRLLGDVNENPQLRVDAAHSLVELGYGIEVFPTIGRVLAQGDLAAAVLTVELYQRAPKVGRALIVEAMRALHPGVRAQAFWVGAAVADARLSKELRAGLSDPDPEVRMAASWALGNLGDESALDALEKVARDGDDEVQAFALRAIQRVRSQE